MKKYFLIILSCMHANIYTMDSSDLHVKNDQLLYEIGKFKLDYTYGKKDPVKKIFSYLKNIYTFDVNNQLPQKLNAEQIKNLRDIIHDFWQTLSSDERAHPALIPICLLMHICYGDHLRYVEKTESQELRTACKIQQIDIPQMLKENENTIGDINTMNNNLALEEINLQKSLATIEKKIDQLAISESQIKWQTRILYSLQALMKNATSAINQETQAQIKDLKQDIATLEKRIHETLNPETKDQLFIQKESLIQQLNELELDSKKIHSRLKRTNDTLTGTAEQITDMLTTRFGNMPGDRTRFMQGWKDYWITHWNNKNKKK